MIDPLIFAAYLIVAGVGSVFAVSQLIRIARKGGSHGTRSRAAAERLDLFPPDVELGVVQRSEPDPIAEPVADRESNLKAFTRANAHSVADVELITKTYLVAYERGLTDALAEFERKRFAEPHRYRNARTGFGGSH